MYVGDFGGASVCPACAGSTLSFAPPSPSSSANRFTISLMDDSRMYGNCFPGLIKQTYTYKSTTARRPTSDLPTIQKKSSYVHSASGDQKDNGGRYVLNTSPQSGIDIDNALPNLSCIVFFFANTATLSSSFPLRSSVQS